MSHSISRRKFLGQASCAAVGSLGFLSTLLNLRLAGSAAAQTIPVGGSADATDDYRALVCLFFAGGMDSYHLLMPASGEAYDTYAATRGGAFDSAKNPGGLALPRESILALQSDFDAALGLGVHPGCADDGLRPGLASLYRQGSLAFIPNVGTLVEHVSKSQYVGKSVRLPRNLFSHADQLQQWQTSVPTEAGGIGWAGRAADILQSSVNDSRISMNVSVSGNNVWQTGRKLFAYSIGDSGSLQLANYNSPFDAPDVGFSARTALRTAAVDNILHQEYQNLFDRAFAGNLRDSLDASSYFSAAYGQTSVTTPFPGDPDYAYPSGYDAGNDPARHLGQQLKSVVRTMTARQSLGLRRQTFFVNFGGWDHHDEVIASMHGMVDILNRCLAAYWAALGETGLRRNVTLFSASDFGRTLTSNGRGSDHAWGGNAFVLGGSVLGGRVHGAYPDLALDADRVVTHRGVTIPDWSVDEYFAELALWLGVPAGRLDEVLPRIREFYLPAAGSAGPIGFMRT